MTEQDDYPKHLVAVCRAHGARFYVWDATRMVWECPEEGCPGYITAEFYSLYARP